VDVARTNGNNVAIAVNRQVFVSTNALAATVGPPSGVIFTNITRDLPNKNVTRVIFDPKIPTRYTPFLVGSTAQGTSDMFPVLASEPLLGPISLPYLLEEI
jgi:hypothetical protein